MFKMKSNHKCAFFQGNPMVCYNKKLDAAVGMIFVNFYPKFSSKNNPEN